MTELGKAISLVRAKIEKHHDPESMNEQNTKTALIDPILRAIGWLVGDLDEVVQEYRRKRKDNPVDYAMMVMRTPRLFLEAKALGHNLDDEKWAKQVLGYATVAGVQWVVLSNGDEYRIYNSHAVVPIEKKLFRTIRISDPESKAEDVLSLISKEQLQEKTIDLLWSAQFVDRQVKKLVGDLFHGDPDEGLIKLIQQTGDDLTTDDVFASLQRANVTIDYPEILAMPKVCKPQPEKSKAPAVANDVSLAEIVSQGLIKLPCRIFATYHEVEVSATIEAPGRIVFGKEQFRSLSTAASAARKHVLGTDAKKGPSTNGWAFWNCIYQGERVKMGDLRKRAGGGPA